MCFKLMVVITVLSVLFYCVIGIPLATGFDSNDDSEIVEVPSNDLIETQDSHSSIIDLSIYGSALYRQPDLNRTGNLVAKFKPNRTSANPEELGSYLEGDILMPQDSIILKNGLNSKSSRWPKGIVPFEIAYNFKRNDLDVIAFAMDAYHENTCIRFKLRTNEFDYISIVGEKSGCWSAIGRVGGKQKVNFQNPGCLIKPGTAIHELMHVLGFIHEQNRNDRDAFVKIQLQNVEKFALSNFQRVPNTEAFGVRYDYRSVMHYSPRAFSSNGQPTIVAKRPIDNEIMGQRDGFSKRDIDKINRMYECKINSKPREPPIQLQVKPSLLTFIQGLGINRIGGFIGNIFSGFNKVW